jgi:hypothetical protein
MSIARKLDNFFSSRNAFMKIITVLLIFSFIRALIYGMYFSLIINGLLLLALHYRTIKRFFRNRANRIRRHQFERDKKAIEAAKEARGESEDYSAFDFNVTDL